MTSVSKLTVVVEEWPGRDDLTEFLHQPNAQEEVQKYLTLEADTLIQFRIGELDFLSGYPEAFFLPLHAFARSMSRGLKQLDRSGKATVPIYLQQYAVEENDPAHIMEWIDDGSEVKVSLTWGGQVAAPAHIRDGGVASADRELFRMEISRFLDSYMRKTFMLVGSLPDWDGKQIESLFADF